MKIKTIINNSEYCSILNRYLRLLREYKTTTVTVSINDIAKVLVCSSRYARVQLFKMVDLGWVCWTGKPGRGKLGFLRCRLDRHGIEALLDTKNSCMSISKLSFKYSDASLTEELKDIRNCINIPFYRPLMPFFPGQFLPRTEMHLMQMTYVGLTKFLSQNNSIQPGICVDYRESKDRLTWSFYLNENLIWHDGSRLEPSQLYSAVDGFIKSKGMPYVTEVIKDKNIIHFNLSQPDSLLPLRLANPLYSFSHPNNFMIGMGPFKCVKFCSERVVFHKFTANGCLSQVDQVHYDISFRKALDWASTVMLSANSNLRYVDPDLNCKHIKSDALAFLCVNDNSPRITSNHSKFIHNFTCILSQKNHNIQNHASDIDELFSGIYYENYNEDCYHCLPPALTLAYYQTPLIESFANKLKQCFNYRGCKLSLIPIQDSHWYLDNIKWERYDLLIGFFQFSSHPSFSLEEFYRNNICFDVFFHFLVRERINKFLSKIAKLKIGRYGFYFKKAFKLLLKSQSIIPLFMQEYKFMHEDDISDIEFFPQLNPDFTSIKIKN